MNHGEYHWAHVSGRTGTKPFKRPNRYDHLPFTELEKLRLLNEWNSKQPGVWVYWIADAGTVHPDAVR